MGRQGSNTVMYAHEGRQSTGGHTGSKSKKTAYCRQKERRETDKPQKVKVQSAGRQTKFMWGDREQVGIGRK